MSEVTQKKKSGSATASMVLGIISTSVGFFGFPISSIVCGVIAIVLAMKAKANGASNGKTTAGLITGIIGTVYSVYNLIMSIIVLFIGAILLVLYILLIIFMIASPMFLA